MASPIIAIADMVTATLQGASLSLPALIRRVYVPVNRLEDLQTLTISVVPTGIVSALADRGGRSAYDYSIEVGIQQSIGQGAMQGDDINLAADPLMALADEITVLFRGKSIDYQTDRSVRCIEILNQPIFYPPHIDEMRVFTALLVLTFRELA